MKAPTLCVALLAAWLTYAQAAERPNILMILIDDLGAHDLGYAGSESFQTPNIDKLAGQGMVFENAYAAAAICSPTRGSIVTGKYPARTNLTDWIPGHRKKKTKLLVPDWQMTLAPEEVTIGEALKAEGYATAWIGKWHLGGEAEPTDHGFDAGKEDWNLNHKDEQADQKGVYTLNEMTKNFITANQDKPFFVCLSHYSVHDPIRATDQLLEKYQAAFKQNKPKHQKKASYAAMVEDLDLSIGQLLNWMDEQGHSQNTVVVFFSDNGGKTKHTSNMQLRDGKGTLYEGGVRVPMIVRWPGVVPAGSSTSEMVNSIDLFPTFMNIAGSREPLPADVDGIDISRVLSSNAALERDTIYWHYPHYHKTKPAGAIRKGNYKLLEYFETGKLELYDLSKDPSEKRDLAQSMPEKAQELHAELVAWREGVGAQRMELNPNYKEK